MLDNSNPLVIVLSRNYSTGLGVIRSLGSAGYTVDLIASTKKKGSSIIASSSKYVRNSVEVLTPNIQGDSGVELIDALMNYANKYEKKIVLFPVDDFTASVVDSNRDILKEHFLVPKINNEENSSLVEAMNKTVQGEFARNAGLITPLEWVIPLNDEIIIPKEVVYPCFVKPLQSISGHKTEMAVCNSKAELKNHLLGMKSVYNDRSILVQEYLNIDKEYSLSGVCLDQEIIIPGVIEKTQIAKHERGVAVSGKMVPLDELGEAKNKIIDMLRQFHYIGMFDMDLNLCGNKIYFSEVNLRSGGTNYAYFLNGVNLPDIFVKAITGNRHNSNEEKIECFGKTFVYEKVLWEEYIYSHITKQELNKCIDEADFTLLVNEADPKPGNCFYKRIRLSALKHRLKRLIGNETKSMSAHISAENNNDDCEKPLVVVTGRNYGNILTMARDFGTAGYEVVVLRVFKTKPSRINLLRRMKPEAYSKYVTNYNECIAYNDPERVVNALADMAEPGRERILIPVDDYMVSTVDSFLDKLSRYYTIPNINNKTDAINSLMDKNQQKCLAADYDLPMLHSVLVKSEDGKFEISDEVHYPCFVKPNISMKSNKAKMVKCDNYEELNKVLTGYARSEDFEMLIEEFADIKAEYSILGLSTKNRIIAPGLFQTIEGGHKERKGVALIGEMIPCTSMQDMIDKCNDFIQGIGYTGLFDVDLIETKNGNLYFVELNFRAGASAHALTEMGVNLPAMFADYIVNGKTIIDNCSIKTEGKRFINEKVLMEEYARSDVSMSEVRRMMDESDIYFIKDENDLKPYRYFKKFYAVTAAMRVLYKVKSSKR